MTIPPGFRHLSEDQHEIAGEIMTVLQGKSCHDATLACAAVVINLLCRYCPSRREAVFVARNLAESIVQTVDYQLSTMPDREGGMLQ